MEKKKFDSFLPECFYLFLIVGVLFTYNTSAKDSDNKNYSAFENHFQTMEFQTKENKRFKLKDVSSSTIIVNFWASWCIPCLEEIPSLIELAKGFKKNQLQIVLVNTEQEDQLKNIAKIEKKYNFSDSFLMVPDKNYKIADKFKFSAIPVTVIYKNGKVVYFSNGPVNFLKLPKEIFY